MRSPRTLIASSNASAEHLTGNRLERMLTARFSSGRTACMTHASCSTMDRNGYDDLAIRCITIRTSMLLPECHARLGWIVTLLWAATRSACSTSARAPPSSRVSTLREHAIPVIEQVVGQTRREGWRARREIVVAPNQLVRRDDGVDAQGARRTGHRSEPECRSHARGMLRAACGPPASSGSRYGCQAVHRLQPRP